MKSTGFHKNINEVLPHLTHIFGEGLHDQKQENFIPVNYDEYQASPSIFFKATNSGQRKEDKNGVSIFTLTHNARYAIAYYSENMFLPVTRNLETVI